MSFIERHKIFFQPVAVTIYFLIYMFVSDGDRVWQTFLPILAFSLGLDASIKRYLRGHWEFPLPGVTTGIATILILRSVHQSWPYFVAIAVALFSKWLLRDTERRHIFNPAALGLLAVVTLFPAHATIHLRQWAIPINYYAFMLVTASFVTVVNGKWRLSFTYLGLIFGLRALWGWWTDHSQAYALGAIASLATLIFAFHMITDPKTSPRDPRGQIVYGVLIALIDFTIRTAELPFSSLLALCLVNAAVNPWRDRLPLLRSA